MNFKLVFSLILIALVAVFLIQNATVVEIRFLFWSLSMSRALFMLFMLVSGVLIGWLLHSYVRRRK